ncbi:uncharacterized protein LOC117330145 [Pecten maximus]|uniref:uncharacterized protein LOC117330145 n=1 Tax=Pecten maximus TaxID=6579 RepID=UPI001458F33B|nr:uncharacterized protein LOC117330145 [Pecten maximus]
MEEGSGLESLINQRLTRPSYSRMVSWEFSNQQEVNPVKRKRRRSKKHSNVDEEVNFSVSSADEDESDVVIQSTTSPGPELCVSSSDDDCLYFSAEETISSDSDSVAQINQGLTSLDIEEISTKDSGSSKEDSIAVSQPPQEKKHAPSKKQKRKRRKSKNSYVLHAGEILSVMEIDIEPDIIGETHELVEESLACIEKAVPSLVELCLNCTRRRKVNVQLPKGLKNMVQHTNKEFTFRKFQVSWLQNEFSKWQPFEMKKPILFFAIYADSDDWGCEPVYKCLLPTRNIWNNVFYPQYLSSYLQSQYACSKTSSILPFTFVTNPCCWQDDHDSYQFVFQQRFLGCLATLVDLMMPAVLIDRNVGDSDECISESEQILAATKIAMRRVKGALNVR